MIKFKQKLYFFPALVKGLGGLTSGIFAGTSLWGIKQAHDANEQQEEANEIAAREQKRHNKAMEEAARENPAAIQKDFGIAQSVIQNIGKAGKAIKATKAGGFANDLIGTQKGNIKNALGWSASLAGTAYLGNRLATSIKNHDEGNDKANKNFLKKAALTAGVVGGSLLAAKKVGFGKPVQNFMTKGKAMNPIARNKAGKISVGGTLKKNAFNGVFVAMPTVSYLAQKKSQDDMVDNTQKEYSAVPMSVMKGLANKGRQVGKTIKQGFQVFKTHPGQSISGGLNKAGQFMGMYGKESGTKGVQNTVSKLAKAGQKSGNEWTQKTAKYLGEHKTTANLLATGGALAVGGGLMKAGTAVVEKPTRLLDKEAYKMEDQENDKI